MKKLALLVLLLMTACTRPPIPQDAKRNSGSKISVHTALNLQGTTKDLITIETPKKIFDRANLTGSIQTADFKKKQIAKFKCTIKMQETKDGKKYLGQAKIPFKEDLPKGKYNLYLTLEHANGSIKFKIPYWVGYSSLF